MTGGCGMYAQTFGTDPCPGPGCQVRVPSCRHRAVWIDFGRSVIPCGGLRARETDGGLDNWQRTSSASMASRRSRAKGGRRQQRSSLARTPWSRPRIRTTASSESIPVFELRIAQFPLRNRMTLGSNQNLKPLLPRHMHI